MRGQISLNLRLQDSPHGSPHGSLLAARPTEVWKAHSRYRSDAATLPLFGERTDAVDNTWEELLLRCSGDTLCKLLGVSTEWAAVARNVAMHKGWPFVVNGELDIAWAYHPVNLKRLIERLASRHLDKLCLVIGNCEVWLGEYMVEELKPISVREIGGMGGVESWALRRLPELAIKDTHAHFKVPPNTTRGAVELLIHAVAQYVLSKHNTTLLSIGKGALAKCEQLTSVIIPGTVLTIGEYAFEDCIYLTSVTIPKGVTTIGENAFAGCDSLTEVTIPGSVTTINYGAFAGCFSLDKVTIEEGVETIEDNAFAACRNLRSVAIPSSVTTIEEAAFADCSSLVEVTIEAGVKTIGDKAFAGCSALVEVTIPVSVETIGAEAFEGCSALASVKIPDCVTTIGDHAFEGCKALASVEIHDFGIDMDDSTLPDWVKLTIRAGGVCAGSTRVYQQTEGA